MCPGGSHSPSARLNKGQRGAVWALSLSALPARGLGATQSGELGSGAVLLPPLSVAPPALVSCSSAQLHAASRQLTPD